MNGVHAGTWDRWHGDGPCMLMGHTESAGARSISGCEWFNLTMVLFASQHHLEQLNQLLCTGRWYMHTVQGASNTTIRFPTICPVWTLFSTIAYMPSYIVCGNHCKVTASHSRHHACVAVVAVAVAALPACFSSFLCHLCWLLVHRLCRYDQHPSITCDGQFNT